MGFGNVKGTGYDNKRKGAGGMTIKETGMTIRKRVVIIKEKGSLCQINVTTEQR